MDHGERSMKSSTVSGRVCVHREGIEVGEDGPAATLDILFDGYRVWSIDSRKLGETTALIPWPSAIQRFLSGRARVCVREHVGGRVHFDEDVQFSSSDARIRVVGPAGNRLALNKHGRMLADFDTQSPEARQHLISQLEQVLTLLNSVGQVPAYLCYGSLLGAIREGRPIGHDCDFDIAFLSASTHPMGAIADSLRLERMFVRDGWTSQRISSGTFTLRCLSPDGGTVGIDVFASFYVDGFYHLVAAVRGKLERSALLPLGTTQLEGHILPAPAQPSELLRLTYGPDWRTPDPGFRHPVPHGTRRRMAGWLRGVQVRRKWWIDYYRHSDTGQFNRPSAFARWVAARVDDPPRPIVDVGCGAGRDTRWLSRQGHDLTGLDYAPIALRRARQRTRRDAARADYRLVDIHDSRHVLTCAARLTRKDLPPTVIYARSLLDSLDSLGRSNFWLFCRMLLGRCQGLLYTEFRLSATERADGAKEFDGQWLSRVSVERIQQEAVAAGGQILTLQRLEGRSEPPGLARCRMEIRWDRARPQAKGEVDAQA